MTRVNKFQGNLFARTCLLLHCSCQMRASNTFVLFHLHFSCRVELGITVTTPSEEEDYAAFNEETAFPLSSVH